MPSAPEVARAGWNGARRVISRDTAISQFLPKGELMFFRE